MRRLRNDCVRLRDDFCSAQRLRAPAQRIFGQRNRCARYADDLPGRATAAQAPQRLRRLRSRSAAAAADPPPAQRIRRSLPQNL